MKTTHLKNLLAAALIGALAITTLQAEQSRTGHYMPGATASFIDTAPSAPGIAAMNIFLNYNEANANGSKGLPFRPNHALLLRPRQNEEE